ncbi:unnamed protein product [Dicrocoelium dendriticum]|nr:unnamed protein product [Dicrocoelium dendriticum]
MRTGMTDCNSEISMQERDVVFVCAPEHHRGHISNIRCLAVPRTIGSEYQTKPSSRFLLTGGGRGQIGLWRFNVPDLGSGDLWRPGWLGYTLLRLTESTDPRTQHHRRAKGVSSSVNPSLSADLRIMALLCSETPEVSNCDTRLLSLAACSDGSIRLLVIYPPNHTHPKSCKFVELGSLRQLCPGSRWRHPAACYLDLQWVECGVPDRLNVLATNTRGCVECWSVCLVDADPTTWIVSENWSLFAEPIAPFYVLTAPAINCVDTFTLTPFDWHLAVGGDDGSVRIGSFLFSASRPSSPSWITAATHHYASVIQLRVVKRDIYDASGVQRLLTLAADQRLIVWSWSGTKLLPLCCSLLPGLGDPHGLALDWLLLSQAGTVGHSSTWALTVGTGLCLLELDGQS